MEYYKIVSSAQELLGENGIWRLPEYLPDVYVMDEARKKAFDTALKLISRGENVLIIGSPGTGKTAFMFMLLKSLLESGIKVGIILEGATQIAREHEEKGVVLFYDDLPRMNELALRSIFRNNVRGIVATARTEEVPDIRRKTGENVWNYFNRVEIPGMSKERLKSMLLKYADKEGIKIVSEEAVDIVAEKAQGLPVYVWQLVRELRIKKRGLDKEFAEQIPQGMFDYVDDILWRVLDEHADRYAVLLTLLIMTDLVRYALHQDLYNYVFVTAKEEMTGRRISAKEALLSDVLDAITRYLARESATMTFRLPHDSWADVLRGRSGGPMSAEISKVNTLYPYEERVRLLKAAIIRAWNETIAQTRDAGRRNLFLENVRLNFGDEFVRELLAGVPKVEVRERPAPPKPAEVPAVPAVSPEEVRSIMARLNGLVRSPRPDPQALASLADRLVGLGVEDEEALNLAAVAYLKSWERTRDPALFTKAVQILSRLESGKARYNLGTALYKAGRIDEALRELEEAISRGFQSPSVYYNLAIAALRLNKPDKALKALERYLMLVPHDIKAEKVYRRLRRLMRVA